MGQSKLDNIINIIYPILDSLYFYFSFIDHKMNGNRASGLRRGYAGPSLHGDNASDQKGIAMKGDFRQASHTMQKKMHISRINHSHQMAVITRWAQTWHMVSIIHTFITSSSYAWQVPHNLSVKSMRTSFPLLLLIARSNSSWKNECQSHYEKSISQK